MNNSEEKKMRDWAAGFGTFAIAGVALAVSGFLGLGTSGCGSSPKSCTSTSRAVVGSCTGTGFCNDFTGSAYLTASQIESTCKGSGATFSASACPVADLVGSCLVYCGNSYESTYHYYAEFPGGVTSGARQCSELKGAWTAN